MTWFQQTGYAQSQWWQCSNKKCGFWNRKGKCSSCGLKKSWGQQFESSAWDVEATTAQTEKANQKLAAASSLIHDTTLPDELPKGAKGEQLRQLEMSLKSIPEGEEFDQTRQTISNNIASVKRSITVSKPIGSQIDSCRAAIGRAEKRRDSCKEQLSAASASLDAAEADLAQKHAEFAKLESQIVAASQPDCIHASAVTLTRVIGEMAQSPLIPPEALASVNEQVVKLITTLNEVAALAQSVAQAQTGEETSNSNDKRKKAESSATPTHGDSDTGMTSVGETPPATRPRTSPDVPPLPAAPLVVAELETPFPVAGLGANPL